MAIKVKAKETLLKIGKYAGSYRYVLSADLYSQLSSNKVIAEASLRSGLSKGVMNAAWEAIGDVISAWATEGHSVAVPGLGSMRFGLNAKSVASVEEVSSGLITTRKVIFVPSADIKQEPAQTQVRWKTTRTLTPAIQSRVAQRTRVVQPSKVALTTRVALMTRVVQPTQTVAWETKA